MRPGDDSSRPLLVAIAIVAQQTCDGASRTVAAALVTARTAAEACTATYNAALWVSRWFGLPELARSGSWGGGS